MGLLQALRYPSACSGNHQAVDAELAPVVDWKPGFGGVSVQNRRNVVLGVPSGEEHGRDRQHPGHTLLTQGLETIPKNRPSEFQIAVFNRHRRQLGAKCFDHLGEFFDC